MREVETAGALFSRLGGPRAVEVLWLSPFSAKETPAPHTLLLTDQAGEAEREEVGARHRVSEAERRGGRACVGGGVGAGEEGSSVENRGVRSGQGRLLKLYRRAAEGKERGAKLRDGGSGGPKAESHRERDKWRSRPGRKKAFHSPSFPDRRSFLYSPFYHQTLRHLFDHTHPSPEPKSPAHTHPNNTSTKTFNHARPLDPRHRRARPDLRRPGLLHLDRGARVVGHGCRRRVG